MCNGHSSRISGGGLLAVLRAPPASSNLLHGGSSNSECRLFLRNPADSSASTTATLEHQNIYLPSSSPSSSISSQSSSDDEDGDYFRENIMGGTMSLVIHRDGDLLNQEQHPLGPLHTVHVPPFQQAQSPLMQLSLSTAASPSAPPESASQIETWPLSRLDLGVGPTGVVGRRVQLVLTGPGNGATDRETTTTTVLREGILGWN